MAEGMELRYCLITPAYNEEANLPGLFESVRAQTIQPVCWVIVNDGSDDGTGRLIDDFAEQVGYVEPVHLGRDKVETYYSRKIFAFSEGYRKLAACCNDYGFLGNLDADIAMPPDYYEKVLGSFAANPRLGIAGGGYVYEGTAYAPLLHADTVPGSILMFRRECYEAVGGYLPLRYGAEDTLACVMARTEGWEVELLSDCDVVQRRVVGMAENNGILKARFRQGLSEYDIGYHPLFTFVKFVRRCFRERPFVIGSFARYLGYLCGPLVARSRMGPPRARNTLRREQLRRVFHAFK